MTAVEKLLSIATSEIGYLEKASNSQLDSKTANAGDKNYTKYARDLDAIGFYNGKKNGYAWCDMFVDWCLVQAFGVQTALAMTGQKLGGYGAGCTESVNYYKAIKRFFTANPQPGDQIFFTQNKGKTYYHTGIVTKIQNGRVYTIEGNTSSASGVVPNGGAVRDKSYLLSYSYIGGYGRPNYSLVPTEPTIIIPDKEEDIMTGAEIIDALTDEQAYKLLKKAQAYAGKLAEPDWSKKEGHWSRATSDGTINGGEPEGLIKRDEVVAILGRKGLI